MSLRNWRWPGSISMQVPALPAVVLHKYNKTNLYTRTDGILLQTADCYKVWATFYLDVILLNCCSCSFVAGQANGLLLQITASFNIPPYSTYLLTCSSGWLSSYRLKSILKVLRSHKYLSTSATVFSADMLCLGCLKYYFWARNILEHLRLDWGLFELDYQALCTHNNRTQITQCKN